MLGTSCPAAPPIIAALAEEVAAEEKCDRPIEFDTLLKTSGMKVSAGF